MHTSSSKSHGFIRGFSLVEMMACVSIIGIIAFMAIPSVTRMRGDSERNLAIARAEAVLTTPRAAAPLRVDALKLLARGRLLEGHWDALMHLLEAARRELGYEELMKFEESARQLDRPDEAERIRAFAMATR